MIIFINFVDFVRRKSDVMVIVDFKCRHVNYYWGLRFIHFIAGFHGDNLSYFTSNIESITSLPANSHHNILLTRVVTGDVHYTDQHAICQKNFVVDGKKFHCLVDTLNTALIVNHPFAAYPEYLLKVKSS